MLLEWPVLLSLAIGVAPAPAEEPMRGLALANIALSTPDPDRMADWYRRVLGFEPGERAPGVSGVQTYMIERDGLRIDLIRVPNQRAPEVPLDPPRHLEQLGLRNLVFLVDDRRAANAHLKQNGVSLIWESLPVAGIGTSITAFRDPDGNLVALWERK